jgi:serine/threonine protein kinase
MFLQVLAAVQYAHVNLVVHRDIKPANVLINQQKFAEVLAVLETVKEPVLQAQKQKLVAKLPVNSAK